MEKTFNIYKFRDRFRRGWAKPGWPKPNPVWPARGLTRLAPLAHRFGDGITDWKSKELIGHVDGVGHCSDIVGKSRSYIKKDIPSRFLDEERYLNKESGSAHVRLPTKMTEERRYRHRSFIPGCKWGGESPWGRGFPAMGMRMKNLNGDGCGDEDKSHTHVDMGMGFAGIPAEINVDLVGGYYDAGDNVKFGLPMAFTITMMSWSIVEYGKQMAANGELGHAMEAVKWGTDYLIKAHPQPYVLYGEVGDGNSDHFCWQRPEDMTTDRRAYRIDTNNPGSDLAGETAAAMAAASIVFRRYNPAYSNELLSHAKQLFEFADKYRGKYDSSITVAQKYYRSYSGYADELLWSAAWMYQATNDQYYLDYLGNNGDALGGTGWAMTEFGWDVKYAGAQVLAAKVLIRD
ncbi:hypothetical protein Syun_031268 [Stephania yunnanensis]|uniref:cellulase n=1 Tax=Stephania yunnanensis TaxID=152371 RepID=A0AAP0E444_9MAGN